MASTANTRGYPLPVRIAGVGRHVPARRVESAALERECGLPEGSCGKQQGVLERRWAEEETVTQLAAQAVREAAADADLPLASLQLLVNASVTPENLVPDGSALILRELGLGSSGVAGLTLHTSCLSFLSAFDVCSCLIALGRYDNAVIVSAETSSSFLHPSVADTYTLLGDGAAAAVLRRSRQGEESCVHAALHRTYGDGADHAKLAFGGALKPATRPVARDACIFKMQGREILRTAETHAPRMLEDLLRAAGVTLDDLRLIITHQASRVALDFISLNFTEEKIVRIVDRFGNCAAASIPMTLYEAVETSRLARGDKILITGPAGAGMTMGGVVITY